LIIYIFRTGSQFGGFAYVENSDPSAANKNAYLVSETFSNPTSSRGIYFRA
jgi:hypothetical protein